MLDVIFGNKQNKKKEKNQYIHQTKLIQSFCDLEQLWQ